MLTAKLEGVGADNDDVDEIAPSQRHPYPPRECGVGKVHLTTHFSRGWIECYILGGRFDDGSLMIMTSSWGWTVERAISRCLLDDDVDAGGNIYKLLARKNRQPPRSSLRMGRLEVGTCSICIGGWHQLGRSVGRFGAHSTKIMCT